MAGRCYLAYLIPVIRIATPREFKQLTTVRRVKRTITTAQEVGGWFSPRYGVYVNQEEIRALSIVLESHMNQTSITIAAIMMELDQTKKVALNTNGMRYHIGPTGWRVYLSWKRMLHLH